MRELEGFVLVHAYGALPAFTSVHDTCAWGLVKSDEGTVSPLTAVTDHGEPRVGAGDQTQDL